MATSSPLRIEAAQPDLQAELKQSVGVVLAQVVRQFRRGTNAGVMAPADAPRRDGRGARAACSTPSLSGRLARLTAFRLTAQGPVSTMAASFDGL
jgi:hypothetical protein